MSTKEKQQFCCYHFEKAHLTFVRAAVERYGGDGVDDMPGLRVPIRPWQVENEPEGLRQIRAALAAVGAGATDATNARARRRALREVVMAVVLAGGPRLVEPWAPRARVEGIERQVIAGDAAGAQALDELIAEARRRFE
ncbi:MAG: hypothetical protein HZA54_08385 [Planctomycetes bacterium]|nr:hypothetical protein [Planctomycetota bacterium]